MDLFKFWATFFITIFSFLSCSENTINSENTPSPGVFVVDSLNTNIAHPNDSVYYSFSYELTYHFENQHGSIQKLTIIFQDSVGMVMHFNNAYPLIKKESECFVDSVRLYNFNLTLKDSVKFDISISGVFWDYDFETSTFNGFLDEFNWAKNIWIEIPK